MEKAVYIRRNNGWQNANDNLDIRGNYNGNNTINGTPATSTVPRVFAYTASGWDQIYPAKEQTYKIKLDSTLDYYQWVPGLTTTKQHGWRGRGRASQGFYGDDWYDDKINDTLVDTFRRNIGWLGLGKAAIAKMQNPTKVKKITSLRFDITRGAGSGHYGKKCTISIGLNKIAETSVPDKRSNNPHINNIGNHIDLCQLNTCGNTTTSKTTYIVDLNTSKGQQVAQMMMDWMKGKDGAKSIVLRNTEYTGNKYPGVGIWSTNYTSLTKFVVTMEYISEA